MGYILGPNQGQRGEAFPPRIGSRLSPSIELIQPKSQWVWRKFPSWVHRTRPVLTSCFFCSFLSQTELLFCRRGKGRTARQIRWPPSSWISKGWSSLEEIMGCHTQNIGIFYLQKRPWLLPLFSLAQGPSRIANNVPGRISHKCRRNYTNHVEIQADRDPLRWISTWSTPLLDNRSHRGRTPYISLC